MKIHELLVQICKLNSKDTKSRILSGQVKIDGISIIENLDINVDESSKIELGEFIFKHLLDLDKSLGILNFFKGEIPLLFGKDNIICKPIHPFFAFKQFIEQYTCITVSKKLSLVFKLKMKTHRTWLKIIFNPFLRKIGFVIASKIDVDTDKFVGYQLRRFKNGKIGDKV